ncbi:MAG: glycosyltransferase family 4 protein [Planctomycetes bacterium]|nr:glycosyltransferase family 4 protein [Planctomycetota bacterium]
MKIALIIERMDIQLGGAERSISELSQALTGQGLDVTLLAAQGKAPDTHGHVLCEDTGKRTSHASFARALKTHLSTRSYDIVHSVLPFDFAHLYQPRGGSYAETIVQNAASFQSPVTAKLKRLTAFTNRRRQRWLAAERALATGHKGPIIAALSQYVVQQFKQHYGTPEHRIALIRNGVNTARPVDAEAVRQFTQTVHAQLQIPAQDQPVFFLFAAHNFRLKGLKPLIKAFAAARPRHGVLLIAGHGNGQPYQSKITKHGLERQVLFLGATSQIQHALGACHVAVLPTFYDPASRFILEALGAKKPVITTRFNGACDQFTSNRHGLVIDSPLDINALTQALNALADAKTRQTMAHAIAEDRLVEKVSIERVARELIALYTAILQT